MYVPVKSPVYASMFTVKAATRAHFNYRLKTCKAVCILLEHAALSRTVLKELHFVEHVSIEQISLLLTALSLRIHTPLEYTYEAQ